MRNQKYEEPHEEEKLEEIIASTMDFVDIDEEFECDEDCLHCPKEECEDYDEFTGVVYRKYCA